MKSLTFASLSVVVVASLASYGKEYRKSEK
jgi:hypothetical protein